MFVWVFELSGSYLAGAFVVVAETEEQVIEMALRPSGQGYKPDEPDYYLERFAEWRTPKKYHQWTLVEKIPTSDNNPRVVLFTSHDG